MTLSGFTVHIRRTTKKFDVLQTFLDLHGSFQRRMGASQLSRTKSTEEGQHRQKQRQR